MNRDHYLETLRALEAEQKEIQERAINIDLAIASLRALVNVGEPAQTVQEPRRQAIRNGRASRTTKRKARARHGENVDIIRTAMLLAERPLTVGELAMEIKSKRGNNFNARNLRMSITR